MYAHPPADPWALEAAKLPLAFAQVREDPALDVEVAAALPQDATVVMIASGGETLIQLARLPLRRIHAVDMNPAQLALSRFKVHLAAHEKTEVSCGLLGHAHLPVATRKDGLLRRFGELGLPEDVFGPLDFVTEHGPDHVGRYERCFAELRQTMPSAGFIHEPSLDQALAQVMSLTNLVALFGHEATQNPHLPFHEHFARRTRIALGRADAETNPFLHQMYAGRFAPGCPYDWLKSTVPPQAEILWHQGRMLDVLNSLPAAGADLVHLSNILDWLSPAQAAQTLTAATRVMKPNARLIIRQLNSTLEMETLVEGIQWDHAQGVDMEKQDRSFFYPKILLGTRS